MSTPAVSPALSMELYAKFFHGLANPTRFAIVELLLDRELCVGELVERLQVSQGQVSNQLSCLKWCGFVTARQEGKNVYYRVPDERVRTIVTLGKQVYSDNAAHISTCTRM